MCFEFDQFLAKVRSRAGSESNLIVQTDPRLPTTINTFPSWHSRFQNISISIFGKNTTIFYNFDIWVKDLRYSLPTVISSWEVHNFKVMLSKFKIPLIVQMSRWNKCTKMSVMIWKMKCDPEMNSLNGSRWWYVTPIGKTNPPPGIGLQSSRATKSGTCLIESRLEAIRSELIIHRGRPLKCSGGRLQTSSRLLEKTSVDAVCFYSPLRILPSHGVCAVQLPKISWKSGACGTILFLHAAPYQLLEYQTCKEWGRLTFIL